MRDPERIQALSYQRYEANISDHRPISAGLKIKTRVIEQSLYRKVRSEIETEWFKHEAGYIKETVAKQLELWN